MILSSDIEKFCQSEGFELKLAAKQDIDKILQLYKDRTVWFRENQINQWQKYLIHHDKNEFLKSIKNDELFVIYQGKEIVACFEISEESRLWDEKVNDSFYIYKIVTKVGTKKLGKLIFDICEMFAKTNGKKFLKIDCLARNEKLNQIYESHGFKLIKTGTKDYYTFNLRRKSTLN